MCNYSALILSAITKNNMHFEKSWADIESNPDLLAYVGSKSNFLEIYELVFDLVREFYKKGVIKGICLEHSSLSHLCKPYEKKLSPYKNAVNCLFIVMDHSDSVKDKTNA